MILYESAVVGTDSGGYPGYGVDIMRGYIGTGGCAVGGGSGIMLG